MAVVPMGHKLADQERVSLRAFSDEVLSLPYSGECQGYVVQINSLLDRHGIRIIEVANKPALLRRPPIEALLRQIAGGRSIHARRERQPAEMIAGLLGRQRRDRHPQRPANRFRDGAKRHAFFRHRMIASARDALLQRQPVQPCGVEAVHRAPAVTSVAHSRDDAERLDLVLPGSDVALAPTHWSFGQLAALVSAPATYLRQLPAPLAGINLQYGLTSHRAEQVKTLENMDGRVELRAVTGPDYGRIYDHELVAAVQRIAGNGTGDTRWKVPGVLDWSTGVYNPLVDISRDTTTLYASDRDVFLFLVDDLNPIEAGRLTESLDGSDGIARKHKLLLMLDEFPALGRLDFFESALAFMAGYGLRSFLIAQSLNQIEKAYGPNNAILDNCHVRVAFASNDERTARRRA